jgi:hypothetical protein
MSTRRPAVRRRTAAAVASGAALLASLLVSAPAQASVLLKEHYDDNGSEAFLFCGGNFVHSYEAKGTFTFVLRGSSPAPFGADRGRAIDTYTNLDTGRTFTTITTFNERDHRILVDTDQGTLTISVAHAGSSRAYSDAGLLFHDAGHYRFEVVIDYGKSLTDDSDDTFLSYNGITFGPKGRSDTFDRNFCEDLHTYTD